MTDKTPTIPAEPAPRARKAARPRTRKQAKSVKPKNPPADGVEEIDIPLGKPLEVEVETSSEFADWPEPEPASTGGPASGSDGVKRKRRRKKGKGGRSQEGAPIESNVPSEEGASSQDEDPLSDGETGGSQQRPPQSQQRQPRQPAPRPQLDYEAVGELACKIYLAEVSEEGVALIGDGDAKELARRCFRLSEIFLEEQSRRR